MTPETSPVVDCPVVDCMVRWVHGLEAPEAMLPPTLFRDEASLALWPEVGEMLSFFPGAEERASAGSLPEIVALLAGWNVVAAQVAIPSTAPAEAIDEVEATKGRCFVSVKVDPHRGMRAVRELDGLAARSRAVRSASVIPALVSPQVAPNAKEYFPLYTKCAELGLPVMINVGFPGPRVPGACQDPIALDEVCWYFPELTVVMKHGGSPWTDTCRRLVEKWPNAYYATTGLAPHRYPDWLGPVLRSRTHGHKVLFGGYWPLLGYDRVFAGLDGLGLDEATRRAFLFDNANRLFDLGLGA